MSDEIIGVDSSSIDPRYLKKKKDKKDAKKKRESPDASLTITSLMDAMTIILCFLLKSYSTNPVNVNQSDDLKLPSSISEKSIQDAVSVTVTRRAILVADKAVVEVKPNGKVDASYKRDGDSGYFINPVYEALVEEANKQKTIAQLNPGQKFDGMSVVVGHKDIRFRLITEVLYTAGQAEFSKFQFAIVKTRE